MCSMLQPSSTQQLRERAIFVFNNVVVILVDLVDVIAPIWVLVFIKTNEDVSMWPFLKERMSKGVDLILGEVSFVVEVFLVIKVKLNFKYDIGTKVSNTGDVFIVMFKSE